MEVLASTEVCNPVFAALQILRLAHVMQLTANPKEISVSSDYTF